MIVEEEAHVLYYEVGAPAVLNGVMTRTIPSKLGIMDPSDIERAIMKRSLHTPGTAVIALENTHNRAGGTIVPLEMMAAYREIADRHGVPIHLDGARVFNAAVALGKPVAEVVAACDTVSFCLSKGLASPVGSVLVGPAPFIDKARIWRKRLGGGMRQAGILAACGIVSLTKMVDRLDEDHARAKRLAAALDGVKGLRVDHQTVQTNMVLIDTDAPAESVLDALRGKGVWALPPAENRIRCVFHNDIDDAKTDRAIDALRSL
jgi:threonine aldolase